MAAVSGRVLRALSTGYIQAPQVYSPSSKAMPRRAVLTLAAVAALATLPASLGQGRDKQAEAAVAVTVEQLASSMSGYATFRVSVEFQAAHVQDVYALFGENSNPLIVPPAYQVAAPFGSDVGPVTPRKATAATHSSSSSRILRQYHRAMHRSTIIYQRK